LGKKKLENFTEVVIVPLAQLAGITRKGKTSTERKWEKRSRKFGPGDLLSGNRKAQSRCIQMTINWVTEGRPEKARKRREWGGSDCTSHKKSDGEKLNCKRKN